MLKLDFAPSIEDNFFDLGGDSLASAELIIDVEEKFSCQIPVEEFLHSPTVATLDRLVKQRGASLQRAGVLNPIGFCTSCNSLRLTGMESGFSPKHSLLV